MNNVNKHFLLIRSGLMGLILLLVTPAYNQFAVNTKQDQKLVSSDLIVRNDGVISTVFTNKAIHGLAISNDAKYIVSGGAEQTIQVWNTETMEIVNQLKGHQDDVLAVAISPNSRLVASGGVDNKVMLWDIDSGELIHEFIGHTSYVRDVHFSPNGRLIASGSWDKTVKVWDIATGTLLYDITEHPEKVSSVEFSPNGRKIITGCSDHNVRIWDMTTTKLTKELTGHQDEVSDVNYSNSGKLAASSAWDNQVQVWNTKTGEQIMNLAGHQSDVWGIAFSSDGQLLATCGGDRTVKLWDIANHELIATYGENLHKADVEKVVFHPDGTKLISASRDGSIRFWRIPNFAQRFELITDRKMTAWRQPGKFEKTKDYEARIKKAKDQHKLFKRDVKQNITNYINEYGEWKLDIEVGAYNADQEFFHLHSKKHGDFQLYVPIAEAEVVSEQKDQLFYHNIQVKIGYNGLEIKSFNAFMKELNMGFQVLPMSPSQKKRNQAKSKTD